MIRNAGSDTMVNVAQAWAEEYAKVNAAVSVEVSGGGSATGIAGLIDGVVDLANCSRRMEASERARAEEKNHHGVVETIAGHDALALYVHPENPLDEISLEQLGRMFGRGGDVERWSQLGINWPHGEDDRILLISRQSNSGTYEYFRNSILGKRGEFRAGTRDLNGSKEVVSLIASTRAAIGYSGMGYAIEGVKTLRIKAGTSAAVAPTVETAQNGTYKISRPLYIYSLEGAAVAITNYLQWILSPVGQAVVRKAGYVPLVS
ncbi:MAG: phosphate ABC transporter substrate-binding protein [Bryobacter sp.]